MAADRADQHLRLVVTDAAPATSSDPDPRAPGDAPAPDLRVVERRRRRRRPAVVATVAVVSVFSLLFALAVFQTMLVEGQQHLDRVTRELADAERAFERMRLEVARQEAPENVMARAQALGMVVPDKVTYLTPTGQAVLEATTATETLLAGSDAPRPATGASWPATKPYVTGANP